MFELAHCGWDWRYPQAVYVRAQQRYATAAYGAALAISSNRVSWQREVVAEHQVVACTVTDVRRVPNAPSSTDSSAPLGAGSVGLRPPSGGATNVPVEADFQNVSVASALVLLCPPTLDVDLKSPSSVFESGFVDVCVNVAVDLVHGVA